MAGRQEVFNNMVPVLFRWMRHHSLSLVVPRLTSCPSRDLSTLVLPTAQLQDSLVVVKAVLGGQVGADRWRVLGPFADDPGLAVEADLFGEEMGRDLHWATRGRGWARIPRAT